MGRTKRDYPRKLAGKLRKIRDREGLSQSAIAGRLGVKDRASISQFETGTIEPPLPVLLKYAQLAGVTVDVLIDDKASLPK